MQSTEISAPQALQFIDALMYEHTGQYLSDLERQVFLGAWKGQTYETIYPQNPQYIEKSVGYRLWRKLSDVLGEKVTKKRIRGATLRYMQASELSRQVISAVPTPASPCHIAICSSRDALSLGLVRALRHILLSAGYRVSVEWLAIAPDTAVPTPPACDVVVQVMPNCS